MVGDMVIQPLRPLFLLFNALSSVKEAQGDHLKECLQKLEAGMSRVNGSSAPQVWFGHPENLPPSLGGAPHMPGKGLGEADLSE